MGYRGNTNINCAYLGAYGGGYGGGAYGNGYGGGYSSGGYGGGVGGYPGGPMHHSPRYSSLSSNSIYQLFKHR